MNAGAELSDKDLKEDMKNNDEICLASPIAHYEEEKKESLSDGPNALISQDHEHFNEVNNLNNDSDAVIVIPEDNDDIN